MALPIAQEMPVTSPSRLQGAIGNLGQQPATRTTTDAQLTGLNPMVHARST